MFRKALHHIKVTDFHVNSLREGWIDELSVTIVVDKIFIAVPRRNHGIPSTLNYVKLDGNNSLINPKLHSYPSYEMNELDVSCYLSV